MLEADWLTLGAVTLSWEPFTGFDVNGAPTYAAATSASAIVQYDRRLLPRPDGQTEQARAVIFVFSTSASITLQDRITLPGSTETPRLLGVDKVDDENGQHHIEVVIA